VDWVDESLELRAKLEEAVLQPDQGKRNVQRQDHRICISIKGITALRLVFARGKRDDGQ
jgi:hypothetical protein